MALTRDDFIAALRSALEPLPFVLSMWEGGSAAFAALDEHSDIDLQLDIEAGTVAEAFEAVEAALGTLGPIDSLWKVPEPTWHGYPQRFYHVTGAPEFLYIDLVLRPLDQPARLTEREHHGEPLVHFDKTGNVRSTALDLGVQRAKLEQRIETLRAAFPMLSGLCRKELLRGNAIDAAGFYFTHTLRPLVELLRIRHCPQRHEFGLRYVDRDLPADVNARLEQLCYYATPEDLAQRHAHAVAWFHETLGEVEQRGIELSQ